MIFKQQMSDLQNELKKYAKKTDLIIALQNVSKNIVVEKFKMNNVFKLLFEELKCQVKLKTISKCVLFSLSSFISNISIWQKNDLYCDVLNHDFDSLQDILTKNVICRAKHFVRMIVFKKNFFFDRWTRFAV